MAYSRTNALGTYVLQVLETGRWSLSVLDNHLGSKTSSWFNNILSRSRAKGSAVNSNQFRELTRVLLLKSSSHGSSVSRYSQRRLPIDATNYREAISEARAEMLSKALRDAGNSDAHEADELESMAGSLLEFVVYTAILEKVPGNDMVVILSTDRVVVAGYKRTTSDSHIKCVWQCRLVQSRAPLLNTSGASNVLTFRAKTEDRHLQSAQSAKTEFEIRREHNDVELVNIYNALNALLGNFEYFVNPQPDVSQTPEVYYESDTETFHIGPWAYAKELDDFEEDCVGALGGQSLKERLEKSPWLALEGYHEEQGVPEWLEDELHSAVCSHEHIVEISSMKGDSKGECMLLDGLRGGFVSLDEFRQSRSASAVDASNEHKDSSGNNRNSLKVQFVVDVTPEASDEKTTEEPQGSPRYAGSSITIHHMEDSKSEPVTADGDESRENSKDDDIHHQDAVSGESQRTAGDNIEGLPKKQEDLERRMDRLESLVIQLLAQHLPSEKNQSTASGKFSPRR